jgi:hypothetical protein
MVCFDQLNVLNLACAAMLVRRVRMMQEAVKKCPKAPDFSGLRIFLSHLLDADGGITASELDKHISQRQRADVQILKQSRL